MFSMSLRAKCWVTRLGITNKNLPIVTIKFSASERWREQLTVLRLDILRTNIDREKAERIMLRYACNMPNFGYAQGNLYVLKPILKVFTKENDVFWSFARIMDILNIFGPMNRDVNFRKSGIPAWVTDEFTKHEPDMDMEWLQIAVQLRWLYIAWGQTCDSLEIQCTLMDYAIRGRLQMYQLAAAMLRHFYHQLDGEGETMFKFKTVFEFKITTLEQASVIIASAATQFPDVIEPENRSRRWRIRPG
ncbi:MAG: hypothetical protein CMM07_22620 [Rhodopirellula sp.]|nr:hypothetical protein [Rhodopirellula sp.]